MADGPLVGHDGALALFFDAWEQGRLHHAWLLTGPAGIGKASAAAQLAARLAGCRFDAPPPSRLAPLDRAIVAQLRAGAQTNVRLITRQEDGKGKLRAGIVVDQVRQLGGFLSQTAADGHWRVVVIDAADDMGKEPANALLKLLEEPPAGVVFLLVSHAPGRLLPTIRSRCRVLPFRPLDDRQMRAILAQAGVPAAEQPLLLALGDGCPGRVMRWSAMGLGPLNDQLEAALAEKGPARARIVHALAASLAHPAQKLRFEAFLELVVMQLGRASVRAARGEHLNPPWSAPVFADLERGPLLWDKARALARAASGLMLDPAVVVVRLFGLIDEAGLAAGRD